MKDRNILTCKLLFSKRYFINKSNHFSKTSYMSRIMRKLAFCVCSNCIADLHLCFCYIDRTIPLLLNPKFQAANHFLWLYDLVCVGPEDIFSCVNCPSNGITSASPDSLKDSLIKLCGLDDEGPDGLPG